MWPRKPERTSWLGIATRDAFARSSGDSAPMPAASRVPALRLRRREGRIVCGEVTAKAAAKAASTGDVSSSLDTGTAVPIGEGRLRGGVACRRQAEKSEARATNSRPREREWRRE